MGEAEAVMNIGVHREAELVEGELGTAVSSSNRISTTEDTAPDSPIKPVKLARNSQVVV